MVSFWKNLQHLSAGKKSTLSFMRYCKDIVRLFLVLCVCLANYTQSDNHLVENFCVYLQAKTQLHLWCFNGDIAKICKLILGTLGMPGHTHPMIVFNVYLHAKNKLHNSLLSYNIALQKILEFDWLAAFWPITWDPKLCQICWWNINNNLSFHYTLFPRKTNTTKFLLTY